jgi:hypothetical protein
MSDIPLGRQFDLSSFNEQQQRISQAREIK